MIKDIDILFYLEHYNREIETIRTLKSGLKDKRIAICSTIFEMGFSKLIYKPKLVITPWLYDNRDYYLILSFLFTKNIRILNLHHEQVTNEDRIEALLPKKLACNGYHISWGKNFTEQLLKIGIEEKFICETGSIRLQQTRSTKYTRIDLVEKIEKNIDINKKWTLFISSYSWKNLSNKNLKEVEKRGRKNVKNYRETVIKSYNMTLSWIEEKLILDQESEFIYRLHPSEIKDEKLIRLEKKYKNFYVIKELELKEWIANSDEIELWISTGIAEVIVLDKPFRIIRPIQLEKNVEIQGFEIFDKIKTLEEYLYLKNGEENLFKGKKYLQNIYTTSKNSEEETINFINKILNETVEEIEIKNIKKIKIILRELIKDSLKFIGVKLNLKFIKKINKISKEYGLFYEKR